MVAANSVAASGGAGAWIESNDAPPEEATAACVKFFGKGQSTVPMEQIHKVQKLLLREAHRRDTLITKAVLDQCDENGHAVFVVGNPCRKGCLDPDKPYRDRKTGECQAEKGKPGVTQRCDQKTMDAMDLDEQLLTLKCWSGGAVTFSVGIVERPPDWNAEVRALYQKHNPSKLDSVPALLDKYKGRERVLIAKLKKKYTGKAANDTENDGAVGKEDDAMSVALDTRWDAMPADNRCEVCKMITDEATLAVERTIMAQKVKQAAEWTGTAPFSWGDLKMKLFPRPAIRGMCVRKNFEAYFKTYVGAWERTAEIDTTVDDVMAGCRALVQLHGDKGVVFKALLRVYTTHPIEMPLSYVGEKMPDKLIPKGNLKMTTEQHYPSVCVDAAELCTADDVKPIYGKARKTAPK